jgi:hypothetical protein
MFLINSCRYLIALASSCQLVYRLVSGVKLFVRIKALSEISVYFFNDREPGSSVSIVSGYRLDDRAIKVRSPAEARGFFL